jgi:hypothetical protein
MEEIGRSHFCIRPSSREHAMGKSNGNLGT